MTGPWRTHTGSSCPTDPSAEVNIGWRCGRRSDRVYLARQLVWANRGEPYDIAEYRVVGLAEEAR
jgi:hypothetical protein